MSSKVYRLLQESYPEYEANHSLNPDVVTTMKRVLKCRTESLGGHVWSCQCGVEKYIYNSCKNRFCPQCSWLMLKRWTDKTMKKVIQCDHFHAIFTIPKELNVYWLKNTKLMAHILFQAVKETLTTFSKDPSYIGGQSGFILTLHTWGQNLTLHPHIHSLITAGGVDEEGNWVNSRSNFLFPVKPLMVFFRGRFLTLLRKNAKFIDDSDGNLHNLINDLFQKNWHVYLKEKYSHGKGIFLYLSRYVKGGPIKDSRLKQVTDLNVHFGYHDYRDGKKKIMILRRHEFLRRLLLHVPPAGFPIIKYCGLYSPNSRKKHARNLKMLEFNAADIPYDKSPLKAVEICETCGREMRGPYRVIPLKPRFKNNPIRAA